MSYDESIFDRIYSLCVKNKITVAELLRNVGLSKSTLTELKKGRSKSLSLNASQKIADYFNVTVDYIIGGTTTSSNKSVKKIPVLGYVQAGIPIDAIEEILDYEEISEDLARNGEYVGLMIKGDSMEPKFSPGDVVIVRLQPTCESGDICVVLVNGDEATVKKVERTSVGIKLIPLNSAYDPLFFTNQEIEELPVRIFGRVVELRAKF